MADVFISYAREDRGLAERSGACARSRAASRSGGIARFCRATISRLIAAELAHAKAVVVVWSPTSIASGWVRDEAHEGLERQALVPVLIGGVEPPMGFRSIQAADLSGWDGGAHPASTICCRRSPSCAPAHPAAGRSRKPQAPPIAWWLGGACAGSH